ncbi:MAG: chemotaxis protein CheW [Acidobacteriaceae bacterium]
MQQETRQYATFRLHDLFLGIEVDSVQEIIRQQKMTVVPLAPSVIEGLINLRGQIVIAIDARRSLGLPQWEGEDTRANIVVRSEDGAVSLLVDDIDDVMDVPLDAWSPVPDNMPAEQRELIECVYNLKQGLMLAIDTAHLLQVACS